MGKGFRNKTCVYCGVEHSASTADHVIARKFFVDAYRLGLPKVPACVACNNDKSRLEHYVLSVLPLGSLLPGSPAGPIDMARRRIQKNRPLHVALASGLRKRLVKEGNGPWQQGATLPFDAEQLTQLGAYLVRGLAWHYWKVIFPPSHSVKADLFNADGRSFFEKVWEHPAWTKKVAKQLDGGVVSYRGASSDSVPFLTVWEISFFGGVELGADPAQRGVVCRALYCATFDPSEASPGIQIQDASRP